MIRPPQAKRADAELHMPFDRLDALVGGLHGLVHVLPAPCREFQRATGGLVARISVAVGKLDLLLRRVGDRIRIKVIVDMNAIHVVAPGHVQHHRDGLLPHFRHAGVHPPVDVVFHRPLRVRPAHVRGARRVLFTRQRPVRIEPCVQLHPALVRLRHRELQRVPAGRFAHLSGQKRRPRLNLRGIHRIARRADLEDQRVQPHVCRGFDQREQLLLLLRHRQPRLRRPVDVPHRRDPRTAQLTCWRWHARLSLQRDGQQPGDQKQEF